MTILLHPIGRVRCSEQGPREDFWGDMVSQIVLDSEIFVPESLAGLADFSHIEVLFHLHGVEESEIASGLRHPRGNANWPQVGIFAQRAKVRPNRIAATICPLLSVHGLTLTVQGLDALDGSPVLDIKPVFAEFVPDHASIRQPAWSHALMREYFASGSSGQGSDRP